MDKNGAPLLIELLHMWEKYKKMAKCLGGFFLYLDRHGLDGKNVDSLNDISVRCFHDLVSIFMVPINAKVVFSCVEQ